MNIVKGLITSIDFNGNTCVVRLPLFESAANKKELLVTATFATQPGIYNGYKVNDVVYVAFENNEIDSPVVIGKLYLGADKESKDPRGAINAENLKSASPMTLPIDTHLTLDNDQKNLTNVNVDGELAGYKTIADFARKLKKQDTKVGALNIKVIDDGNKIGNLVSTKVSKASDNNWTDGGRDLGFGWDINDQRWRVYSSDSSRTQNPELDILTVDPHGVTITGDVKIVGYPTATLVLYNQTASSSTKPAFEIEGDDLDDNTPYKSATYPINTEDLPGNWQLEVPDYVSGQYIWEKTITFSYQAETLLDGRKVVEEYWISKTICTSGSVGPKGDDATSYTISLSSPIHTGALQTKDIIVTALKQTGSNPIGADTAAQFTINGTDAPTAFVTDNILTIPAAWFTDKETDVRIQVKHGGTVIDDETITYSPLNTPVLDLTNDTDSLPYDTSGKIGTGNAISEATVYLNGTEISGAIYTWTLTNCTGNTIDEYNNDNVDDISTLDVDESLVGKKIKITSLLDNTATATCTVSNIGYSGLTLSKDFTITKQWKGAAGTNGESTIKISIENDFDSIITNSVGTIPTSYDWETETFHTIRVYEGTEAQPFSVTDTIPTTGDAFVVARTLTNVTIDPNSPGSSQDYKKYEAYLNSLSADSGEIKYDLYKGTILLDSAKFSIVKIKAGVSGTDGYNNATVTLYKRGSATPASPISQILYYKFETKKLYTDAECTTEYSLPTGWSYTIAGAGAASSGNLYCVAAIASSNTDKYTISTSEWAGPTLYVENGAGGQAATSYWLKLSSPIHLGVNQEADLELLPMKQVGTSTEEPDTGAYLRYSLDGGTTYTVWTQIITTPTITPIKINAEYIINKNIIVEASHDSTGSNIYATETITYAPATTPVLDLSRDSGAINYDSDGEIIGESISTTATIYLGETVYTGAASFSWSVLPVDTGYTVSADGKTITINSLSANTATAICTAICTGRDSTGTPVQNLQPLYKTGRTKISSGALYLIKENETGPVWQNAVDPTDTSPLTQEDITNHYITLAKAFTVNKQITGDPGAPGASVATAQLFKRSNTEVTTKPVSTSTNYWNYYFTDSGSSIHAGDIILTGTDAIWNGCTSSIPSGTDPVYETHAAVITTADNNYVKITNWSTPAKFVENGASGADAIDYKIILDNYVIKISKSGERTPSTITADFKKVIGTANPVSCDGKYKVYKDGTELTNAEYSTYNLIPFNSQQTEVSSITLQTALINDAQKSLKVELYVSFNSIYYLVESEIIEVIADGVYVKESNDWYKLVIEGGEKPDKPVIHLEQQDFETWTGIAGEDGYIIVDDGQGSLIPITEETMAIGNYWIKYDDIKYQVIIGQWETLVNQGIISPKITRGGSNAATEYDIAEGASITEDPKDTWTTELPNLETGYDLWVSTETVYSDDTVEQRHVEFTDPSKNTIYKLVQGKSTNYYSDNDPANPASQESAYGANINIGDCWFSPVFEEADPQPSTLNDYIGKYIKRNNKYILVTSTDGIVLGETAYVKAIDAQGTNKGTLKQWNGTSWEDISKEIIANKVTATYINALDITAKNITVIDPNITPTQEEPEKNILFKADSNTHAVKIAGWAVNSEALYETKTLGEIGAQNDFSIYLGARYPASNVKFKDGITEIPQANYVLLSQTKATSSQDWITTLGITNDGSIYATDLNVLGGKISLTGVIDGVQNSFEAENGAIQVLGYGSNIEANSIKAHTIESTSGEITTLNCGKALSLCSKEPNGIIRKFVLTVSYNDTFGRYTFTVQSYDVDDQIAVVPEHTNISFSYRYKIEQINPNIWITGPNGEQIHPVVTTVKYKTDIINISANTSFAGKSIVLDQDALLSYNLNTAAKIYGSSSGISYPYSFDATGVIDDTNIIFTVVASLGTTVLADTTVTVTVAYRDVGASWGPSASTDITILKNHSSGTSTITVAKGSISKLNIISVTGSSASYDKTTALIGYLKSYNSDSETFGDIEVAANLVPAEDFSSAFLGTSIKKWQNIFGTNINGDTVIAATLKPTLVYGGPHQYSAGTNATHAGNITVDASLVPPLYDGCSYRLGGTQNPWTDIYVKNIYYRTSNGAPMRNEVVQSGTETVTSGSGNAVSVDFWTEFSNTPTVVATISYDTQPDINAFVNVYDVTTTGFKVCVGRPSGASRITVTVNWIACADNYY